MIDRPALKPSTRMQIKAVEQPFRPVSRQGRTTIVDPVREMEELFLFHDAILNASGL